MTISRTLAVVGALTTLALAPAARAAWGPPIPLAPRSQSTRTLGLAIDGAGHPAVLLARRESRGETLLLRRGDSHRRMGAAVVVARSEHAFEGAGLYAGGGKDLVAGWLEIIRGARRAVLATGPRLATQQVLSSGSRSTQFMSLAANRRGEAVAAWWTYAGAGATSVDITAALREPGGRFQPPQTVAHGSLATGTPRAAIDAAGHAVLAWSEGHSVALAERAPAATAFARSASVATSAQIAGDPAVAVDGGAVLLAWRAGRPAGSAIVAIQRPRADAPFGAPQTLTAPGVRIPHWVDPDVDLDNGEAIVAWVQGTAHTTANDRAAVAIAPPDGRFGTSVTRAVRPPAHVYELELLAAAPGRPPIVVMTSSRASRLAAATATVRSDGSLAPTRDVPLGGAGGFRPWAAQGRRRAWLATERFTAPGRGRQQALLLGST